MSQNARKKKTPKDSPLLPCGIALLVLLAVLFFYQYRQKAGEKEITLPRNTRVAEDFQTENGRISYPGAITGIDVSSHQKLIDWPSVQADGIDFAVIQLGYRGYTDGGIFVDNCYVQNLQGAREAGLQVGVYFFSQATSVDEAQEEAQFVLNTLDGTALDYPVFFDWEEVSDGRTGGLATPSVTEYALAFCQAITAGGYDAGVYFNQSYGYSIFKLPELADYTFWLAEYNSVPSFGYEVQFWQYTGDGGVAGIDGRVDMNLYFIN